MNAGRKPGIAEGFVMIFGFLGVCCAAVSFTACAYFWLLGRYFRDPEVQRRQEAKFVRGEWRS